MYGKKLRHFATARTLFHFARSRLTWKCSRSLIGLYFEQHREIGQRGSEIQSDQPANSTVLDTETFFSRNPTAPSYDCFLEHRHQRRFASAADTPASALLSCLQHRRHRSEWLCRRGKNRCPEQRPGADPRSGLGRQKRIGLAVPSFFVDADDRPALGCHSARR